MQDKIVQRNVNFCHF